MKLLFKDPELLEKLGFVLANKTETHTEFVFDDEPLEQILYGKDLGGPTRANYFLPSREYVHGIDHAHRHGNRDELLELAWGLGSKKLPISITTCSELVAVVREIVPDCPKPVIEFHLSKLRPLLEHMWSVAQQADDKGLQDRVGPSLFRWYEHHHHYQEARGVLAKLIEIYQDKGDRTSEAIMTNNYAFEYLLEGRCQEALPIFETVAGIFKETGNEYEYANSRANYWTCRFECDDLEDIDGIETELKALKEVLKKQPGWHARKPLILLAKIEERRGNVNGAITLVEQAIETCKKSNTQYPQLDRKYLEHLKRSTDRPQE